MAHQIFTPVCEAAVGPGGVRVHVLVCAHAYGSHCVCFSKIRAVKWKDVITQAWAAGRGTEAGAQACPWGQAKARCQNREAQPVPVSQGPGMWGWDSEGQP